MPGCGKHRAECTTSPVHRSLRRRLWVQLPLCECRRRSLRRRVAEQCAVHPQLWCARRWLERYSSADRDLQLSATSQLFTPLCQAVMHECPNTSSFMTPSAVQSTWRLDSQPTASTSNVVRRWTSQLRSSLPPDPTWARPLDKSTVRDNARDAPRVRWLTCCAGSQVDNNGSCDPTRSGFCKCTAGIFGFVSPDFGCFCRPSADCAGPTPGTTGFLVAYAFNPAPGAGSPSVGYLLERCMTQCPYS